MRCGSPLASLRSKAADANNPAGSGRELMVAQHQLRDWIEAQLDSLQDFGGEKAFADRINRALKTVSIAKTDDEQNPLGSLNEVRLKGESGMLIVTTGIGIICQSDDSAYGYKRVNGRWQRVCESEQSNDSPEKYAPQHIVEVTSGRPSKTGIRKALRL